MAYVVKCGEEMGEGFLEKVMEIDAAVYPDEYVGLLENMQIRYRKNPRTFVYVMDEENGRLAGYINFFPVIEPLWEEIVETGMKIRDDDISAEEVALYQKGKDAKNRLFIISVAIHPEYQKDKNVVINLTNGWIAYLNGLKEEGFPITAISATAVSPDGMKFLRTRLFRLVREIEDGNRVYVCDGDYLEKLLENKMYFKTFRDDVYLLIPFAENSLNPKTGKLLFHDGEEENSGGRSKDASGSASGDRSAGTPGQNGEGASEDEGKQHAPEDGENDPELIPICEEDVLYFIEQLDDCLRYECSNEVKNELWRFYRGELLLLHTLDDYAGEGEGLSEAEAEKRGLHRGSVISGEEDMLCVVGEEKAYLSILAHRPSHMYVVMLMIPNCAYSTTQLEDQLFHNCLKVRLDMSENGHPSPEIAEDWGPVIDDEGHYIYRDLSEFLEEKYGLLPCGPGKALTCMSGRPRQDNEMMNILAGEAFFSIRQDFFIDNKRLREMAQEDKAIYDYYYAYMSEKVIAYIFRDFEKLSGLNHPQYWAGGAHFRKRAELMATYVFIMELVMFQNTALNKMTMKVSNALAQDGDVSYDYMNDLYRDYARSVKFWQNENFRYLGTQKEATQIREAFGNDELRSTYQELQGFLEEMVELQNAQDERRNGNVINALAIFLAIMQVQEYLVGLLNSFYARFNIEVARGEAGHSFTTILVGGTALFLIIWYILQRKRKYERRARIREHYRSQFDKDGSEDRVSVSRKGVKGDG